MRNDARRCRLGGGSRDVIKICARCGAAYDTQAFLALPFRGRRLRPLDPAAIQSATEAGSLLLRDCGCGSTLTLPLPPILACSAAKRA